MHYDTVAPSSKAELVPELSIRGESIQRIYNFYISEKLIVNRNYQRKLVWNVEEKQKFLDSIYQNYPVPLFLLAVVEYANKERYEIIDGMQRLDAITSFIEQEFGILIRVDGELEEKEYFFNLDALADTKLLKDEGKLEQRLPLLDRSTCNQIAGYILPLSVYRMDTSDEIDEIFRRINSGGRQLSSQEVRQSSSIGGFASLVRIVASKVRGDDSSSDTLFLNDMKKISVSNKKLQYGINVDEIFWVKQGILSREKMRQSNDEEIIAEILGGMILYPEKFTGNAVIFNNMYGIYSQDSRSQQERYQKIENELSKEFERWINDFITVYDLIRAVMLEAESSFGSLVNPKKSSRYSPKHFQTIFLSLYELQIIDSKILISKAQLAKKFRAAGKAMDISQGAYSGINKVNNISAVKGIFSELFREREKGEEDPAIDSWTTKLENILIQSYTEQALYDFKQGLHSIDYTEEFNEDLLQRIITTLIAMANVGKNVTGYVILGIADSERHKEAICKFYTKKQKTEYKSVDYNGFHVTGLNAEVSSYYTSLDKYMSRITEKIKTFPVDKGFLENNIRVWPISYFGKSLVVFRVKSTDEPIPIKDEFYTRLGSNTVKLAGGQFNLLFKKFA